MGQEKKFQLIRGIITEDERLQLLEKAERHFKNGEYISNPAGPHRFVTRMEQPPLVDALVNNMVSRVSKAYDVTGCTEEPVLNKVISRIEAGGFIHQHIDILESLQESARNRGRKLPHIDPELIKQGQNFRVNIMVQMGSDTAWPIIDDGIVEVSQRDSWGFLASKWKHGTQHVQGIPRIIYGFGFIVPKDFQIKDSVDYQ